MSLLLYINISCFSVIICISLFCRCCFKLTNSLGFIVLLCLFSCFLFSFHLSVLVALDHSLEFFLMYTIELFLSFEDSVLIFFKIVIRFETGFCFLVVARCNQWCNLILLLFASAGSLLISVHFNTSVQLQDLVLHKLF